jgi:dephospho-CoA kinase
MGRLLFSLGRRNFAEVPFEKEANMTDITRAFESVICVTGHKGAGKDEFCRRAAANGYQSVRFSDPIREEAVRRGFENYTVQQLIEIGNEGRRQGGAGYWAERLMQLAASKGWKRLVINGARNPGEIAEVRAHAGLSCALVGITAPILIRAARIAKRGQVEDRAELEKFLTMDDADRGLAQPEDGQQVDRCMAAVPHANLYNNAGTLEEYHAWIDAMLVRATAPKREWRGEFGGG